MYSYFKRLEVNFVFRFPTRVSLKNRFKKGAPNLFLSPSLFLYSELWSSPSLAAREYNKKEQRIEVARHNLIRQGATASLPEEEREKTIGDSKL